MQRSYTINKQN